MKHFILYLIVVLLSGMGTASAQNSQARHKKKKAQTEAKAKATTRKTSAKKAHPAKQQHKERRDNRKKAAPQRKKNATPQQKKRNATQQHPQYTPTKKIKGLQQENQRIKQEIKQHEAEYQEKQRDVDSRLSRIITLDTEIDQHQKDIDHITHDIHGIDDNIGILKSQLQHLELQLGERRARFIRSMRYMARHRSIQDKLMFIFSAKSLSQMYRRLRFVREYAAYQRAQGEKLQLQQRQIDDKRAQLGHIRQQKSNLRYKGKQAQAAVTQKKAEQESVVASLQKDQQVLQGVINQRRKQQQALDAQIDRLINIEIQKARQRAAAEAKKRAGERAAQAAARAKALAKKREAAKRAAEENARRVAEAKKREAEAQRRAEAARRKAKEEAERAERERKRAEEEARQAKKEQDRIKAEQRARAAERQRKDAEAQRQRAEQQAREAEANRQAAERKAAAERKRHEQAMRAEQQRAEAANDADLSSADRAMTGSFANAKGRLPMPLSGRIVSHFGGYNVEGLSNVKLSNSGINIKGASGAPVRSVFKGEVSSIFGYGGTMVVMVRHGAYITVYANLRTVSVHQGQKVGTGQTLGTVGSNGILQFQLRKETAKLNPEAWLR